MIEEIAYDYVGKTLTVTLTGEASRTYSDAESYLRDFPERRADCIAVGWSVEDI